MHNLASNKRAILTGATGFVGFNLVKYLIENGWEVNVIIRSNTNTEILRNYNKYIKFHLHDSTTSGMIKIFKESCPFIVFHLASLFLSEHKSNDIESLIQSNVTFSTQLTEAMVRTNVKYLINTGTSWQHFNNDEYNPVNLYAATKQAFESILSYYSNVYGLKVLTLKLFDTYGPNDTRKKLMHLLWQTAIQQVPLSMSPGKQLVDLVYIDDVVSAFNLAATSVVTQSHSHTSYGVSSGSPISIIDLVSIFQTVTGYSLSIKFGDRPYREREVMTPWSNYNILPDWCPKIPLQKGIIDCSPESK